MCRCAYPQEILIESFLGEMPLLNLEIWPKWKILKTILQRNSTETFNRISWHFVVMKDIMCRYAFLQEMLIWSFLRSNLYPFWTLVKIIFETGFQTGFLSDCPSLMLGIAIPCLQHSQAILEHGVCELAHSFFLNHKLHLSGILQRFAKH